MILGQVGWGRGDYVEKGIDDGSLNGAVLGPRDADPSALATCAQSLQQRLKGRGRVFVDPQFYATTVTNARDGSLPDYPYYTPALTRASFGPAQVGRYVKGVLDAQEQLEVDRWVSPTVLFYGFRDPWSQIALTMAQAAIGEAASRSRSTPKPLLLSFVIDELALRDRSALDEYLNTISTLDAHGFYIVIRRNDPNYPAAYEEDALVNLMYLTYVLSEVNDFEVVHGYTDLVGSLLLAAGADSVCTGWYSNLKQFSMSRFMQSKGGRQPRDRYTSQPLLSSLFVSPELEQVDAAGKLDQVLSSTGYDTVFKSGPLGAHWPRRTACLHHWKVLSSLNAIISRDRGVVKRISTVEGLVRASQAIYAELISDGVTFEPFTGPRDGAMWLRALARFRAEADL
jgi:hypothetical protein